MGTDVLDLKFECVLCAASCTLEGHVFQEVSSAIRLVGFSTRAGVYPDTNSGGLCMRLSFSGDGEPV